MKFVCNSCNKQFSLKEKPKCCPYCMSQDIEPNGKTSALRMLAKYNELSKQMDDLMEKYKPLYLEAECIRSTLRTYKARGILTEDEFPKKKSTNLLNNLSEYRKTRRNN